MQARVKTSLRKKRWLRRWGLTIVALLIAIIATPWLVGPPCPKRLVIATGRPDGAYYQYARKYQALLAESGIELEIRATAGSVENLSLLTSGDETTVAFMQGGIGQGQQQLQSLCSLYSEPVLVFYRPGSQPQRAGSRAVNRDGRLTSLRGSRIAVGQPGSGTRAIATELLRAGGIADVPDRTAQSQLVSLGGQQAAEALQRGEIDAAFFVTAPSAPVVRQLLSDQNIELMNFERTAAYERRFPYLSSVTLSAGMIDLERNIPARDITLLAPTANLVARDDLHPALVPLLLKACHEVHEDGGWLNESGEFPSAKHVTFALNRSARRYLKSGPTPLYRYLPFSIAAWLDQVKLLLLPLATLLFPLVRVAPPIYRWRIRRKIYRWYKVLRTVDQHAAASRRDHDVDDSRKRLDQVEAELSEVSVPLSYMAEFYSLKLHVDFVREKLDATVVNGAIIDSRRCAA